MSRRSVIGWGAAAVALIGFLAGAFAWDPPDPDELARTRPVVRATADPRTAGPRVPKSFLGFSQEYRLVVSEVGFPRPNPVLVGLYRTLAEPGGGAPVLRLGGGSQDEVWWNPERRPRPRDILFDVGPVYFGAVGQFLEATGSRTIVGLNLGANRPEVPAEVAQGVDAVLGERVIAYEVGNEPNAYPFRTLGTDASGRPAPARPPGYDVATYRRELGRHLDVLRRLRPAPRLGAPAICCQPWLGELPGLLRAEGRRLGLVTLHRYPLERCGKEPGDPDFPSLAELLRPESVRVHAGEIARAVSQARAAGLRLRITESNSVGCAGAEGVSDGFGAALWAADWTFALAANGVAGVNFHNSSPLYQAYTTRGVKGVYRGLVRPLYYGLLFFAEATPHGARILASTNEAQIRAGANVKVWSTYDAEDGVVRVAVISKGRGPRNAGTVEVAVPGASGAGSVRRLSGPGLTARGGVRWAGRAFRSPTTDGRLAGRAAAERVAGSEGRYGFHLPAASAALLTVPVTPPAG